MPASESAGNLRHVDAAEAERLVGDGQVHILDVRTPQEFTSLGHIPDAVLLPVSLIAAAPAVVARDAKPCSSTASTASAAARPRSCWSRPATTS